MNNKKINLYLIPISIIIAGIAISISIYMSPSVGTNKNLASVTDSKLNNQPENTQPKNDISYGSRIRPVNLEKDPIRGNKDSEIFIVEYADFECPFCKKFHNIISEVIDDYDGDISWVYRHFPLTQIHPQAEKAAIASECIFDKAGNDAFWRFSDEVFANQDSMNMDLYSKIAKKFNIDESEFKSCVNDNGKDMLKNVESDALEALSLGAKGTPFSLIVSKNGEVLSNVQGALPIQNVKEIIDEAIKEYKQDLIN